MFMVVELRIEEIFKKWPVLETKMSLRNAHLDPDDRLLFMQTSFFRIVKHRLKVHDEFITVFITDYHDARVPDELVDAYMDFVEYFKEFSYPIRFIGSMISLEKEKAIVGTVVSQNNEIFSFKYTLIAGRPELAVLTAYFTTEQFKLILEDFVKEYEDLISNIKDREVLKLAVKPAPTGEVQSNIRINIPFGMVKRDNKSEHGADYTYV